MRGCCGLSACLSASRAVHVPCVFMFGPCISGNFSCCTAVCSVCFHQSASRMRLWRSERLGCELLASLTDASCVDDGNICAPSVLPCAYFAAANGGLWRGPLLSIHVLSLARASDVISVLSLCFQLLSASNCAPCCIQMSLPHLLSDSEVVAVASMLLFHALLCVWVCRRLHVCEDGCRGSRYRVLQCFCCGREGACLSSLVRHVCARAAMCVSQ